MYSTITLCYDDKHRLNDLLTRHTEHIGQALISSPTTTDLKEIALDLALVDRVRRAIEKAEDKEGEKL